MNRPNNGNTSLWQAKAMATRRKELKEKMLKGDADAAKALLSRAVESLAVAINRSPLDEHHVIALDYLRTSILEFLDGIPLERAFCIAKEAGGRPRITYLKKLEIFGDIQKEIERLKNSGVTNPVTLAQSNIARKFGYSISSVRRIWDNQ